MVSLLLEENLAFVCFFFGVDNTGMINMMIQKSIAEPIDVVIDYIYSCPDRCSKDNRLII